MSVGCRCPLRCTPCAGDHDAVTNLIGLCEAYVVQPFDLLRKPRLLDVQSHGYAGKVQFFSHGEKSAKMSQFHCTPSPVDPPSSLLWVAPTTVWKPATPRRCVAHPSQGRRGVLARLGARSHPLQPVNRTLALQTLDATEQDGHNISRLGQRLICHPWFYETTCRASQSPI